MGDFLAKDVFMILFFSLLFFGTGAEAYGSPASPETLQISIEQLMADPEAYLGKMVMVTGKVQEVCPMKGCWLDMADADKKVRIKVKDGEIVFDKGLVGKQVKAHGTVYKFDLTKEEAVGYFKHLAEEKNEPFDPASVTEGTTIYQIGGIGVTVI